MDALNNRQIRVSISPTPSLRRKLCSNDPTRCWIWWAIFFVMGKISERELRIKQDLKPSPHRPFLLRHSLKKVNSLLGFTPQYLKR